MTVTVAQGTTLIRIDHASAVYTAVRAAREVAAKAGLPEVLTERAAVIASELAGNIDKHASDGSVFVQQSLAGNGIDIYATDAGPGMANLDYWRIDGHSTTETLGTGLGAVGRLATEFRIRSVPGAGTIAVARVLAPGRPAAGIAHVRLPHEGEERCGDALALSTVRGVRTIAIVDGLGHGPEAGDAAEAAIEVFGQRPGRSLSEQLTAMHRRLRQTRGAAVALARVSGDLLEFCGVGNISGLVLTPGRSQPLLSTPGVVGFSLPATHVRSLALAGPHVIVLHTDGIGTGWRGPAPLGPLPEPALLTADLAQHHRDPRDDATVIAFGPGGDTT